MSSTTSETFAKNTPPNKGLPQWVSCISSFAGLICLSPLLAAACAVIKVSSPGPVLFRQKRMGMGGREFTLYKFRTMRNSGEGLKITPKGDPRITLAGKILRKTKIDELPQLMNVVKGDMALVGPRPEVREYVEMHPDLWAEVLRVKPGITDPITLRLRNEEELLAQSDDPEKFYKDHLSLYKLNGYLRYIRTRSPSGDFKLIIRTLLGVAIPGMNPVPDMEEINRG